MMLRVITFSLPLLSTALLLKDIPGGDFKSLLVDNEQVLTAFTSRSIDSLHSFDDAFEQAAEAVKTPCVRIDCEDEKELCKEYDVNAYPTVRLFKNGAAKEGEEPETEILRYRGRKTSRAIKSFVTKHEMPVLRHVETSDLADFKKVDDIVILVYLRPDQDALLEVFRTVAEKHHHEYVFGYTTDMAAADAESLAMPSIVCYKNTDGDNTAMNGHFKEEDVEKFLDRAKKTVIGDFNERNMDTYMARDKLTVYLFAANEDDQVAMRRELTPTAKKYDQYVKFGVADAAEYAPMAKNFGLSEETFPALAVHAPMNDNVFTHKQGRRIMASTIDAMLTRILQGKATTGQVFGEDAPAFEHTVTEGGSERHDEL